MDTKTLMKQFMESLKKRGIPYKEKEVKLRRINRGKYCSTCNCIVQIEMRGAEGFCPNDGTKLYTTDTRRVQSR